ncbi:MAG TPA: hypothetical protein VMJ32_09120 [Pirellulales bacterium]|nr:hypothetical protein [Pirellulales bacterium]
MKTKDRISDEELLNEANEVLKAAKKNGDCIPEALLDQVFQLSLALRRELDGAEPNFKSVTSAEAFPAAEGTSKMLDEARVKIEQSPARQQPIKRPESSVCWRAVHDFTLVRADRLLLIGLCLLAWLIEPTFSDSPLALSALMFVRVVPIFILGGSVYGRALTGAFIGAGLFFGLLGAQAISVVMWDTHLLLPVTTLLKHSAGIANLLYAFAALGLVVCVVGSFAIRQGKNRAHRISWRLATQVCVLVQVALVAELGHSAWRYIAQTDKHSNTVATAKMYHRENIPN